MGLRLSNLLPLQGLRLELLLLEGRAAGKVTKTPLCARVALFARVLEIDQ